MDDCKAAPPESSTETPKPVKAAEDDLKSMLASIAQSVGEVKAMVESMATATKER